MSSARILPRAAGHRHPFTAIVLSVIGILFSGSPVHAEVNHSELWGKSGEKWLGPGGRLPDFSYVGYRRGDVEIPDVPVWRDITEPPYSVDSKGREDVSEIVQRAVNDYRGDTPMALYFPPGRYRFDNQVVIDRSNLVIRGAGVNETRFQMSRGTYQMGVIEHYHGPGIFLFKGQTRVDYRRRPFDLLAKVIEAAPRGATEFLVSDPSSIQAGDWVLLEFAHGASLNARRRQLVKGSENRSIFDEFQNRSGTDFRLDPWMLGIINWVVQVKEVNGERVVIDQPLVFAANVDRWTVNVRAFPKSTYIEQVGIEGIAFEFPGFKTELRYVHNNNNGGEVAQGTGRTFHDRRDGHKPIELRNVKDGWVRNIRMTDADSGIRLLHCRYCTVKEIEFRSKKKIAGRKGRFAGQIGHYGVRVQWHSQNVLVEDIFFNNVSYTHDVSFKNAVSVVFSKVRDTSYGMQLDHHGFGYGILFTDIKMSSGRRVGTSRASSGAFITYWNVSSEDDKWQTDPPNPYLAGMPKKSPNLIGTPMNLPWVEKNTNDPDGSEGLPWIENWLPETTRPANLYEAQLARRLGERGKVAKNNR